MLKLGFAAAALLIGACVADEAGPPVADNEVDWRDGGKADGQSCEFDSLTGAQFAETFTYKDVGAETGGGHRWRIGFTFHDHVILSDGHGANVTMYLLPEGRAIVDYSELENHGSESYVDNQTKVITHYSIDEATRAITLTGFGRGEPQTLVENGHCVAAYRFTYAADVRTSGLAGGTTTVYSGTSSAFVIDPDHLDDVPYQETRDWFQQDVASGKIKIVRL